MKTLGPLDVVIGGFSYSGTAIARELLSAGRRVRTLTGHADRAPTGSQIETRPLTFDDPAELTGNLRGAQVSGDLRHRPAGFEQGKNTTDSGG
jgi:nucleoside-diphosphate-sugar epimerase